jgi:hypothetical protein
MFNNYLKIQQNSNGDLGIFTTVDIPANTPIMELRGDICSLKDLPQNSEVHLQIGVDIFLCPSGVLDGVDFINHHCDPNCMLHVVGKRAILYSLYVIPKNSELTFDYSTTSTDTVENWKMNCKCNSFKCRQVVSGYQYLSEKQKNDYKKRGITPLFILEPNMFQKTW